MSVRKAFTVAFPIVLFFVCNAAISPQKLQPSKPQICTRLKSTQPLSTQGGDVIFPAMNGAGASIRYNSANFSSNNHPSISVSTLSCFSKVPHPIGKDATVISAFTISVNQWTFFTTARLQATLLGEVAPHGAYGFQIFIDYVGNDYRGFTLVEDIPARAKGLMITMPGGWIGLSFQPHRTYVLEVVKNPDIYQFSPLTGPPPLNPGF